MFPLNPAVMGDIGTGLYVSEDVVPIYKGMLSLATVITPNQFEAERVPSRLRIASGERADVTDSCLV